MSNVEWIVQLLKEDGLLDSEIISFLTIIYNGIILNQNLESEVANSSKNYIDNFVSISSYIYDLNSRDLEELLDYITP